MNQLQEKLKFSPSEASYQALACGCRNQNQGLALLDDMEAEGITAGQSVYGTLIAGAAKLRQFTYLVKLVKRMTKDDVRPSARMTKILERMYSLPCEKPNISNDMPDRVVELKRFRFVEQKGFRTFYEIWKSKRLTSKNAATGTKPGSSMENSHHDRDGERSKDDVVNDITCDDDHDSEFSHL